MDTIKLYKMIGSTITNLEVFTSRKDIEDSDKEYLVNTINLAKKDLENLENNNLSNEEISALLNKYINANRVINNILNNFENEEENKEEVKEIKEETNKSEIEDADYEVITEVKEEPKKVEVNKEVKTKTEKGKLTKGDKRLISATVAAAIIATSTLGIAISINKKKDKDNEEMQKNAAIAAAMVTATPTPTVTPTATNTNTNLAPYFIGNYDDATLNTYASSLAIDGLSNDQIIKAVRLGNFDYLVNQNIFSSREEVLNAIPNLGKIVCRYGSDMVINKDYNSDIFVSDTTLAEICNAVAANQITTLSFAEAKTDKGYDIYKLFEICAKNIYSDDHESNFYFAKVLNELAARKFVSYSLTPDSPIATYYILASIYESNVSQINSLTSGLNLGPIYGDGTMIDGTYGFICSEELIKFMDINNTNNYIYSVIIDDNLVNVQTRTY